MALRESKYSTDYRSYESVPRFQLDRRPGRSRLKMQCPACGKNGCFTPYVDVKTNEVVGPEFGRCDHERKCGYHMAPSGKAIGERESWISNNEVQKHFKKSDFADIVNYIPYEEFYKTVWPNDRNVLYSFLSKLWDENLVKSVFYRYMVGTMNLWSWIGCSIFWQVDSNFVCRTGKIMEYGIKHDENGNPIDVKRVKEGEDEKPHVMFYHSTKGHDFMMRQCLFGEHLLNMFPSTATVNIVEAEKTAIIAAINRPDQLFIATGGLQNFRPEVMNVLRGRKIRAFPDKGDAVDKWSEKVKDLMPDLGIKIYSDINKDDSLGDGEDLADKIIKERVNGFADRKNQD